ncbi:hypothetical protein [Azospirillum thermophilum]|uniref:Uncharacterized protein n=1 Tax=Azospirillum thermophilum TaxID=2202148 RepID=A0A2S2CK66_9PROT|nr:hypothetical protein [Azospirillum thermophilum]AWK84898.1 hypothetical protein DEW08_00675 [Azospirillum thermophilum]
MTDTPRNDNSGSGETPRPDDVAQDRPKDRQEPGRTPGDGTLQDATPAGLSSDELRDRAEDTEGSVQPGTG